MYFVWKPFPSYINGPVALLSLLTCYPAGITRLAIISNFLTSPGTNVIKLKKKARCKKERDVALGRIATKRSKPRKQVPFGDNGIFRGLHWSPACLLRQSFCSRAAHFGPPDFLDTRREHSTHRAATSEDASAGDIYRQGNVIKT